MKSNLIACLLVALLVTGCNENTRRRSVDEAAILDVSQTIEEEQEEDSPEELIEEEPMPVAADELFDDFIFNFASNRRLQLERIDFPLVINSGAKVDTVQEDEWQMERFFMQQGEYTLIFDSEAQKELVKDTSINHAIVEKIFLDNDFKNADFLVGGECVALAVGPEGEDTVDPGFNHAVDLMTKFLLPKMRGSRRNLIKRLWEPIAVGLN